MHIHDIRGIVACFLTIGWVTSHIFYSADIESYVPAASPFNDETIKLISTIITSDRLPTPKMSEFH
jgi:hypothetical protein